MDLACIPPKRGDGLLLLPTSTWQCRWWRAERATGKGREFWPCAGCSPRWSLAVPALEQPDMSVRSAQRPSTLVRSSRAFPPPSAYATWWFCRLNQERSEGEMDRSQQKAGYIWHGEGILWDIFKKVFLILCVPAHELSVALLAVLKWLASLFWWVKDEEHVPAQWVAVGT